MLFPHKYRSYPNTQLYLRFYIHINDKTHSLIIYNLNNYSRNVTNNS